MNVDEEIISPKLAQDLEARIQMRGGDILAVRHELEGQLHALEKLADASDNPEAYRPDIALLLSEIEYLDKRLEEEQRTPVQEKHPGLVERLRKKLGF